MRQSSNQQRYRLGLDLGANSIGWCALLLDGDGEPCGVLDAGVRILTPNERAGRDPQSKQSLAANRRDARQSRKRRDRFLRRQQRLVNTLVAAGLMPEDIAERKSLEKIDPYRLRADALDQRLDLHEIGRAIFHLNQRRGFKSNRIADSDDAEGGAMRSGMKQLETALGAKTLGQFLASQHSRDRAGHRIDATGRRIGKAFTGEKAPPAQTVRFRPRTEGSKKLYDLYPTRQMVEHELREIWKEQAKHHPELTDVLHGRIRGVIINQRPLQKPPVGRCTFRPEEEERAPRALPLFQRFRILSEIASLEVRPQAGRPECRLSLGERGKLASLLSKLTSTVTFDAMRKELGMPEGARFNLDTGRRKGLDPDKTAAVLAKTGRGESFGRAWRDHDLQRQNEIVDKLLTEEAEDELVEWLEAKCGLSEAGALAASKARLPQGHAHIGRSILAELVDVMETESIETAHPETGEIYRRPLTYDEAVAHLGLHHSNLETGKHRRLPYYGEAMARHVISNPKAPEGSQGRIGRVPNPTVHIALNQMRAVVNALVDAYGAPAEIVMEFGRELPLSAERIKEVERQNRKNDEANEQRRQTLEGEGFGDTRNNRLLLRLYEELPEEHKHCVYCGNPLHREKLFSGEVDIDHILPRSKTLDDGFGNKVLCHRVCNREKGNRPPAEAWSGEELREIAERAERLFRKKAWRFAPDAMEKFADENAFLARYVTDSQHVARLAKDYLGHLFGTEERNRRVWVTPGRLTSLLRGMWRLNGLLKDHNRRSDEDDAGVKNRDDHRHHLLDAFVVACTDRSLIKRVATAARRAEELDLHRWAAKGDFPEPFPAYLEELSRKLDAVVISHKPDHGRQLGKGDGRSTSGQLHEETAYGIVNEEIDGKPFNLVTRKPIEGLTEGEIGQVRDKQLREELQTVAYEAKRDGEKLADALARYQEKTGTRRARILKTDRSAVTVTHGGGRFAKAYIPGDNQLMDILEMADGRWDGEGVTVFDANREGFQPRWTQLQPRPRLVMRLRKGDLLEADFGEGRKIWRVVRLEPVNRRLRLVSHLDGGNYEARHNNPQDPFRWNFASYARLREAGAKRVRVDPIGRIQLVGPPST